MRAHLWKLLTLLLSCGVLVLVVLVSDRSEPNLPQQPEQLPAAVVTMGDSTLSGEGGGNYEPGTNGENGNWCHRSPVAPIHQLRLPPEVTRINLACSGAQAALVGATPSPEHPEGSQSQKLAELAKHFRITDVVVQIGANDDPSFTDTVNRCVESWAGRAPVGCAESLGRNWPKQVDTMTPKVIAALQDVRKTMDEAGYAPNSYSLVVQSYASPVSPDIAPELQNLSGCPFLTSDMAWIRDTGVPQLAAGLREAAEAVDARFLDLSRAGHGHEACTGGRTHPDKEWFTRLSVDWESLRDEYRAPHAMQESFHANAAGHAQFGRCLGEFLTREDAQAVCLPDEHGNLEPVPNALAAQP